MTPALCRFVLVTYLSATIDPDHLGKNKQKHVFWHQSRLIHCSFRDAACFPL